MTPDIAPNWSNQTIWTGDNLDIMRGMNSACVDLIYLDPPFNSNANYAAPIGSQAAGAEFKDTWGLDDLKLAWHALIKQHHSGLYDYLTAVKTVHSKSMMSYLIYMAVRIMEMRRLLKPNGSIYLHCDDAASHYLKLLMDSIFGAPVFQNEIIWKRTSNHNNAGKFGRISDRLLFYGSEIRTDSVRIPLSNKNVVSKYRFQDERGRYRRGDLTGPASSSGEASEAWRGWCPADIGRGWAVPRVGEYAAWIEKTLIPGYRDVESILTRLDMLHEADLIAFTKNGTPEIKRYLSANTGQVPPDIWTDINPINSQAKERTGYPTQKPLALVQRIIQASSNEDSVILDPFCGCATACIAAEIEGRQWAGIDISPKAAELVQYRMDRELGMFFQGAHRDDIPQRTDQGEVPRYNTPQNRKALYGEQGGHCAGCREHFESRHLEIDHIIPRSKGGQDHFDNLQLLCGSCNRIKGNRPQEYLLSALSDKSLIQLVA